MASSRLRTRRREPLSPGPIDIHAHAVPARVLEDAADCAPRTRRDGDVERVILPGGDSAPLVPGLVEVDLAERLAWMDGAGVAAQVLSPYVAMSASLVGAQYAIDYARLYNSELTALAAAHPSRFRVLATLPTHDVTAAVQELRVCMAERGTVGAQLPAMFPDDPANDWEELWSVAEELGAVLLIHPVSLSLIDAPFVLGAMVGNPAETTYEMARLLLTGTLQRHSRLKLVVVHGGGFLPYQAGRIEHGFEAYGESLGAALTKSPLEQLKLLHYDGLLHSPTMTAALIDIVGAERVVIGSDHPFLLGDRDPVGSVDQISHLTQEERSMIQAGNLLRLMGDTGD